MLVSLLLGFLQQPIVSDWKTLELPYESKPISAADIRQTSTTENGAVRTSFTFKGSVGDTVHGILVEPQGARNIPCVIILHGLGSNKEQLPASIGMPLLSKGIAYAAIDAPGHGERATPEDKKVLQNIVAAAFSSGKHGDMFASVAGSAQTSSFITFLDRATYNGVLDNRHLLDVISGRPEIDKKNIGLIGYSMGSVMGSILGAVDHRLKELTLGVGGDPILPFLNQLPPEARPRAIRDSCSLYAPFCKEPVFMLNGTHDSIMPRSASEALYNAFPSGRKQIKWYDSDHILPMIAFKDGLDWTAKQLGR